VCLATHGRGASAALVGSVATEVLARGHDSLVLVGPLLAAKPVGTGVVACVSGGPETPEVLRAGVAWGGWLDEPVVAAMVAEPLPDPVRDRPAHRLFGPDGFVSQIGAKTRIFPTVGQHYGHARRPPSTSGVSVRPRSYGSLSEHVRRRSIYFA
jgi:hypothetical protein